MPAPLMVMDVLDMGGAQAFIENVLEPMGLGGEPSLNGDHVLVTELYGSDPEDVKYELEWHGFHVRLDTQTQNGDPK